MASRQRWFVVGVLSALLAMPACSPSGSATPATTSVPPPEASAATTAVTLPNLPPSPTGVPGLAAADPFCAAWSAYGGTLQAIGVAGSFGNLPSQQLAGLELAAAPRLAEVVAAIDASWPAELASERSVVIDQRIGPYARRALRAVDALTATGVTADELALLRAAWQTSLAELNPDVAVIVLPEVPAELQAKIDAAAQAYDKAVTPFADDPSLLVDNVEAPATDQYLAAHCPDLAAIGIGDSL